MPAPGCIHYPACYNNQAYTIFPAQEGLPAAAYLNTNGQSVEVTDPAALQAVLTGSTPAGCSGPVAAGDICDQLNQFVDPSSDAQPGDTILVKTAEGNCVLKTLPPDCCTETFTLEDPTGKPVLVVVDTQTGDVTYLCADGTEWTNGTPDDLALPEQCCTENFTLEDPATGAPVLVIYDTITGTTTYLNPTGGEWAGDPSTLTNPTSGTTNPPDPTDPCTVTAAGITGEPSGAFIDGCTPVPMPPSGLPADVLDPTLFPEFWRQPFTGGVTGSEVWTVLRDASGALKWDDE